MTKDEILLAVVRAMPYSNQIRNIDTQSEEGAVRFSWRGLSFRVSDGLHVERVGNGALISDEVAMLVQALVKRSWPEAE